VPGNGRTSVNPRLSTFPRVFCQNATITLHTPWRYGFIPGTPSVDGSSYGSGPGAVLERERRIKREIKSKGM